MNRTVSVFLVLITLLGLSACSTTLKSTQSASASDDDQAQSDSQPTPAWFNKESVSYSSSSIASFGTAIGNDSSATVSKAVFRAMTKLKKSVSDKLEEVRSEAVTELGSSSGLDSPGFLIAFRKADNAVGDVSSTENTGAMSIKDGGSLRGFAKVTVSKENLIERIGKRLSGHEKEWKNLINSSSFKKF